MAITAVGSVTQSSGSTTLNVNPTATGDALAFSVATVAAPVSIAVSGGGVTTWTAGTSYLDTTNNCYVSGWLGVVTSTGASTITVSGISGGGTGMAAQQFHESNGSYAWSVSSASHAPGDSGAPIGSGLSITYPALTAAGSGDSCYWGHCFSIFGSMSAGSTSGYTYSSAGPGSRQVVFNPSFTGTGSPAATQDNAGAYDAVAMIINAAPAGSNVNLTADAVTLAAPLLTPMVGPDPFPAPGVALAAPVPSLTFGAASIPLPVAQLVLAAPPLAPPALGGDDDAPWHIRRRR